jgi:hypothetical protein
MAAVTAGSVSLPDYEALDQLYGPSASPQSSFFDPAPGGKLHMYVSIMIITKHGKTAL